MTTNKTASRLGATRRALCLALWLAAVALASAVPARAQEYGEHEEPLGGLYGVGLGVGIADPKGLSNTLCFLGRMDLGKLYFVSVLPTVEYWGKSDEVLGTKISAHDLTVGADARYRFGHSLTRPYAGVGLAMHFTGKTREEKGGVKKSDNDEKPGAALLAGIEFRRTDSLAWFVEAKYRFVKDLGTWKAVAGIVYSP